MESAIIITQLVFACRLYNHPSPESPGHDTVFVDSFVSCQDSAIVSVTVSPGGGCLVNITSEFSLSQAS